MQVVPATPGAQGFDTDSVLDAAACQAFRDAGFTFAIRYISRSKPNEPGDLTPEETQTILGSGLALMVVQHAPPANWTPSAGLGSIYGQNARANLAFCGIPAGVSVWLDQEGVEPHAMGAETSAHINAWTGMVSAAGYLSGLYVGYDCGFVTGVGLYDLAPTRYWRSPSRVPDPLPRSWCMIQNLGTAYSPGRIRIPGASQSSPFGESIAGIEYDADLIMADYEGGLPMWLAA